MRVAIYIKWTIGSLITSICLSLLLEVGKRFFIAPSSYPLLTLMFSVFLHDAQIAFQLAWSILVSRTSTVFFVMMGQLSSLVETSTTFAYRSLILTSSVVSDYGFPFCVLLSRVFLSYYNDPVAYWSFILFAVVFNLVLICDVALMRFCAWASVCWLRLQQWWKYSETQFADRVVFAVEKAQEVTLEPLRSRDDVGVVPEMVLGGVDYALPVGKYPDGVGRFTVAFSVGDSIVNEDAGLFCFVIIDKVRYVAFTQHQRAQFTQVIKSGGRVTLHGPKGSWVMNPAKAMAFEIGNVLNFDYCGFVLNNNEASLMGLRAVSVGRINGESVLSLFYRFEKTHFEYSVATAERDTSRGLGFIQHGCNTKNHSSGGPVFGIFGKKLAVIGVHTAADNSRKINLASSFEFLALAKTKVESAGLFVVNYNDKFYQENVRDFIGDFVVFDGEELYVPKVVDWSDDEPVYDFEAYGRGLTSESTASFQDELQRLNRLSPGESPGMPACAEACPPKSPDIPKLARPELLTKGSDFPSSVAVKPCEVRDELRLVEQLRLLEERLASLEPRVVPESLPARLVRPSKPLPPSPSQKSVKKRRKRSAKLQKDSLSSGPHPAGPGLN